MRKLKFLLICFLVSFVISRLLISSTWGGELPHTQTFSPYQILAQKSDPNTPTSNDQLIIEVKKSDSSVEKIDPNTPTSNNGLTVKESDSSHKVVLEGLVTGEPSYKGTAPEGIADPSLAEFTETTESAKEFIQLLSLKPAVGAIESVIGIDERVQVNPTTSYPERAVVLIIYDGTSSGGRCTGWLYGQDIVATAGHCVHDGGSGGGWKTNVLVYPGRNGSYSPYGYCSAKHLYSVQGWTADKNEDYDYGAIKLNCSIGNTTGWFGYWSQSQSLDNLPSIINGYPADKPLEQWKSTDIIRVSQTNKVFYKNDTEPGMSGGPVYYNRPSGSPYCTGYCAMAIHAYALHGSPPYSTNNSGTRITETMFNNLKAWKDAS